MKGTVWMTKNSLEIHVGEIHLVSFTIRSRYQSNGGRRPRNLAVYVSTIGVVGFGSTGGHVSIPEALELLKKLGVESQDFVELLRRLEWGPEVPAQQSTLF